MTIKDRALEVLENNRGRFFSGAELAEEISVSRTAVWKVIKQLQEDGYDIQAISGKGYCLSDSSDIISRQSVEKHLGAGKDRFEVLVYKSIGSTNSEAKRLAAAGAKEGTVVISEFQSEGRGRRGRSFFSPEGTGLYMSIVLRPEISAVQSLYITTAAAVAVARAIETVSGRETRIKWVNDVYIGRKKVCGILTEAAFSMESGGLEYVVLGIGVNVRMPKDGFPPEIADIADAVFDEAPSDVRSELAARIIGNFMDYYENLTEKPFLDEYRRRSIVTGMDVTAYTAASSENVHVLDITDELQLRVRTESGEEKLLSSGEISIKL